MDICPFIKHLRVWVASLLILYVLEFTSLGFSSCFLFSWLDKRKKSLWFFLLIRNEYEEKHYVSKNFNSLWADKARHLLIFDTLYRNESRKSEIIANFSALESFLCSDTFLLLKHTFFLASSKRSLASCITQVSIYVSKIVKIFTIVGKFCQNFRALQYT